MRKLTGRKRRHKISRKKLIGTSEKPRLCVSRSNKNLNAQLIDDMAGKTLMSLSTNAKAFRKSLPKGGNVKAATAIGEEFAKKAKEKGFSKVVFDRSGHLFHGRIKAFAEAARKSGLIF